MVGSMLKRYVSFRENSQELLTNAGTKEDQKGWQKGLCHQRRWKQCLC
jgi:hypothetical protein